jgi:hypothetical protein
VRWRLIDLAQWIFEEFRITIAKQTLSRELRAMGYRKLSARPRHHAQAEGAIEDFTKNLRVLRLWGMCKLSRLLAALTIFVRHTRARRSRLPRYRAGERRHVAFNELVRRTH